MAVSVYLNSPHILALFPVINSSIYLWDGCQDSGHITYGQEYDKVNYNVVDLNERPWLLWYHVLPS